MLPPSQSHWGQTLWAWVHGRGPTLAMTLVSHMSGTKSGLSKRHVQSLSRHISVAVTQLYDPHRTFRSSPTSHPTTPNGLMSQLFDLVFKNNKGKGLFVLMTLQNDSGMIHQFLSTHTMICTYLTWYFSPTFHPKIQYRFLYKLASYCCFNSEFSTY